MHVTANTVILKASVWSRCQRPSTQVFIILLPMELATQMDTNMEISDSKAGMQSDSRMWKSSQNLVKQIRPEEYVLRVDGRT